MTGTKKDRKLKNRETFGKIGVSRTDSAAPSAFARTSGDTCTSFAGECRDGVNREWYSAVKQSCAEVRITNAKQLCAEVRITNAKQSCAEVRITNAKQSHVEVRITDGCNSDR